MSRHVWFWTDIPSPHFAGLYSELRRRGVEVHVIAASDDPGVDRRRLGWTDPQVDARTTIAERTSDVRCVLDSAPEGTVHICSRLDFHSTSGRARRLMKKARREHWALMETIDDSGPLGALKRLRHRLLLRYFGDTLRGVLAIGASTPAWLIARGAAPAKVFPFAYFVEQPAAKPGDRPPFLKFCYVGQLIPRKGVDLLIEAFAGAGRDAQLEIIGAGPEEGRLRALAEKRAPAQIQFHPPVAFSEVPAKIAAADYFVLPSRFDGWGAVVVEALMVGTPVLCSDRCGASVAVSASGAGAVFRHDDPSDLERAIRTAASHGRLSQAKRAELVSWSRCFTGSAGADYLLEILDGPAGFQEILPPWERQGPVSSRLLAE